MRLRLLLVTIISQLNPNRHALHRELVSQFHLQQLQVVRLDQTLLVHEETESGRPGLDLRDEPDAQHLAIAGRHGLDLLEGREPVIQ